MNAFKPVSLLAAGLLGFSAPDLRAQVLTSPSFTPVDDTDWYSAVVRLDFGIGIGKGSVTFESVGADALYYTVTAPSSYPYSPTPLGDGSIFAPSEENIGLMIYNPSPGDDPLGGVLLTVTLDSGAFPAGSVFSARSLALVGSDSEYVRPVSGLGPADPAQLPSDRSVLWAEIEPGLYGPSAATGGSKGMAFQITGGTFSVELLSTGGFPIHPGAVAWTIAMAPVPEASSVMLVGITGSLALLRRRRHS